MRSLILLLALALLSNTGCKKEPPPANDDDATDDDAGDDDAGDDDTTGDDDSVDDDDTGDDDTGEELARWTFLVFMNGDNDLEEMVTHDLNELEAVGSGDGVHVLVQADRRPGFDNSDGDWKDARRYYIWEDADLQQVGSEVVEEIGEVDMGDPAVLADFLMWAHENYPAEHMALVFWDHGDGWSVQTQPAKFISDDSTSGSSMSIAEGEVRDALAPVVAARGPLDVVAFDACNMASWEVAHSLREQALFMVASEATVGMEGLQYGPALALLRDQVADAGGTELADELARSAAELGGEWTYSAVDLGEIDALATVIDTLADAALADPSLEGSLLSAREAASGCDSWWEDYYLDLRDLAQVLSTSGEQDLALAGTEILACMDACVVGEYGNPPYVWAGGLTIMFDLTPQYLGPYVNGDGATWSQETSWGELLLTMAGAL